MTEVEQLEKQIVDAQRAYYNKSPIMSDIEFDALVDQLTELNPDSPVLKNIGTDHTDGFAKVKHDIIMGSQAKANTAEDMNGFFARNGKGLYIAQYKCDGCSIALNYKNGKFYQVVTPL